MSVLSHLEPKEVFYYFEEICGIPHGSGNTKRIADYCEQFAARRVNPPACDSFVKSAKSTGLFITYSQKYGRFFGLSFTFL